MTGASSAKLAVAVQQRLIVILAWAVQKWPLMGRSLTVAVALVAALAVFPLAPASGQDKKKDDDKEHKLSPAEKKRLAESRRRRAAERERRIRERILGARDLEEAIAPRVAEITGCYKKYGLVHKRASGVLLLEVLIQPNGRLRRLHVRAPGVSGKQLSGCVTKIVDRVTFPTRKGFTRATIPFRFLQAAAAKAGPLQSCWSKTGCSSRRPSKRRKKASEPARSDKSRSDKSKSDKSKSSKSKSDTSKSDTSKSDTSKSDKSNKAKSNKSDKAKSNKKNTKGAAK